MRHTEAGGRPIDDAGRGLGHALISEAFRVAGAVGCRAIVTDAYRDRAGWYARYGFVPIEGPLEGGPQRMFLDIRTLRAALRP
jgi:predicted N-acetyltransferase YhbS